MIYMFDRKYNSFCVRHVNKDIINRQNHIAFLIKGRNCVLNECDLTAAFPAIPKNVILNVVTESFLFQFTQLHQSFL